MARKGWQNLSPDYRERLKQQGITRRAYESGVSLKPYRGHRMRERPRPTPARDKYHAHQFQSGTTGMPETYLKPGEVRAAAKKITHDRDSRAKMRILIHGRVSNVEKWITVSEQANSFYDLLDKHTHYGAKGARTLDAVGLANDLYPAASGWKSVQRFSFAHGIRRG